MHLCMSLRVYMSVCDLLQSLGRIQEVKASLVTVPVVSTPVDLYS